MKEELIKYVMENADQCYADDFPINNIEIWIREFFDQYQPERLSPEGSYIYSEFGCSLPIRFNTSEGIKRMEPGKRYDKNLNEIE